MISTNVIAKINYLLANHQTLSNTQITERLDGILRCMELTCINCDDCGKEITTTQLATRIFPIRITHGDCK